MPKTEPLKVYVTCTVCGYSIILPWNDETITRVSILGITGWEMPPPACPKCLKKESTTNAKDSSDNG